MKTVFPDNAPLSPKGLKNTTCVETTVKTAHVSTQGAYISRDFKVCLSPKGKKRML